jgi:DNA sulfur modification protein DndE
VQLNKLKLCKDASDRLKHLKARTGITPNVLSRIGFCLSLSEPAVPTPAAYAEDDREFNRYTLLGEWDDLYVALLRQRLAKDGLGENQMEEQFRAHLNRGVIALFGLVKGPADLLDLALRRVLPDTTGKA